MNKVHHRQSWHYTNTNTLAMILTYGRVLSAIKKALWELMKEYQGVRKSLWDLVEGQERNTAQLERIEAAMEQRWSLEGGVRKKKSGDDTEGSENGPRKIQKEKTLSSASC